MASHWWILALVVFLAAYKWTFRLFGVVVIAEDAMGIVNKKFVLVGSNRALPDGRIVALNGEAGVQADTLAPGLHWGYWPWQYDVDVTPFTTIPEGKIGIVESRDGEPLVAGRVLARRVVCDSFQSGRAFLMNRGERGPQSTVVPAGTYRINTALFSVLQVDVTEIPDNMVGIVTTREGQTLVTGEIAGKEVPGHNMFQDAQAFIDNGGSRGLQEQVMLAGRYFINPWFASVEIKDMTTVPIANVGVVIAYVGAAGVDVTGAGFRHGNLVIKGQKGVWVEPLDPGKYPINTYTHKVEVVPTANVVLNWATGKTEAHKLDERLSSITVRSSDGFTYNLDVSQIIHIPRTDAPKVIARFGSVANLVTQVLEPTIGNYFRNAAQSSDVIDFLKNRAARQEDARAAISAGLKEYDVGAVNTLIGDIIPPAELMKTLTDRKIAEQEQVTFETQRRAEGVRKELQQAKALADTQARVVDAERSVQIAEFNASATVKTSEGAARSRIINAEADASAAVKNAEGSAKSKKLNAEADAEVTRVTGEATAGRTLAVGNAEAEVVQRKTKAVGQDNFALIEVGRALAEAKIPLVPQIYAGGAGADGGSSLVSVLLANLVRDGLRREAAAGTAGGGLPGRPAGG
jgi:uncharacterized membrane protein YqiK